MAYQEGLWGNPLRTWIHHSTKQLPSDVPSWVDNNRELSLSPCVVSHCGKSKVQSPWEHLRLVYRRSPNVSHPNAIHGYVLTIVRFVLSVFEQSLGVIRNRTFFYGLWFVKRHDNFRWTIETKFKFQDSWFNLYYTQLKTKLSWVYFL